jgi:hypothetical protein
MTATFAAYSPGGTTYDADGYPTSGYTSEGSTFGKLAGRGPDTQARTVTIGDSERLVVEGGLHIPISAPIPAAGEYGVGWEYVCTAVGPGMDPALVGKRWLVVDAPVKSYATARRLDVVEVS